MSIQGQGARDAFKEQILRIIDNEIISYKRDAEWAIMSNYSSTVSECNNGAKALEKLKKIIEQLDTA